MLDLELLGNVFLYKSAFLDGCGGALMKAQ